MPYPATFRIGGDMEVNRLGFGALHLTGPGDWGPPADVPEALSLLRRLPDLGVNFIDTADSYGPDVSELLIREALHPYGDIIVATKAGMVRDAPYQWRVYAPPDHLLAQVRRSLTNLRIDRIDLWQLHRVDPNVPLAEQFGAIRMLLDEGLVRHVGLSQVSVAQIRAAQRVFPVATVQNLYNLGNRQSEDIVDFCEQEGIGFIPWHPLASGDLASPGSPLAAIARRRQISSGQVALAWLLQRSPVILPIPGSRSRAHVEENMAAASIILDPDEMDMLTRARSRTGNM